MNSWRKIVMNIIEGKVSDTDISLRESIEKCMCGQNPVDEKSGTLGEALRQMGLDEATKESPCQKVFQKLVFGYKKNRGFGNEDNTKKEEQIEQSVESWIDSMYDHREVVRDLNFIKSCAKEYKNEFTPNVSAIWRGIKVEFSKNLNWIPMAELVKSKDVLKIGKHDYVGVSHEYKVGKGIESWSAEPAVSNIFATRDLYFVKRSTRKDSYLTNLLKEWKTYTKNVEKGINVNINKREAVTMLSDISDTLHDKFESIKGSTVPVIITIKTDKNCIFSDYFADALSRRAGFGKESEVIRVADKGTSSKERIYVAKALIDDIFEYHKLVDEVEAIIGKDNTSKWIERFEF